MKFIAKRSAAILLAASIVLATGCKSTEQDKTPNSLSSLISGQTSSNISSTSTGTQTSSSTSSTVTSTSTSSTVSSTTVSTTTSTQPEQSEPHFSFSHDGELETPTGGSVRISSLSEALGSFSEIASKPVEGSPEEIVKTLMDKNVLCFAAMQGKCWTAEGGSGVQPIMSSYITSVEQMERLFADTYTADQAYRLMHPQEAFGYGNVFQLNGDNKLCFDLSHLRSNNGDSFSTGTYIAIIEANDSEIKFGRYYNSTPSGGKEPNVQHFSAVKENGQWRLDTYITDASAYVQQYSSLIKTNRVGAPELMELAKEQVGNIGGRKYWEWYGFNFHIEWCAAFVSWAYGQAGKKEPMFTGCYSGAEWFKARDQWGDADYADIAPGDAIFFDWNFDGSADHVGLVIGTDGQKVYTVEGNRDDICITRGYDRSTYRYILGYGLMEW